MNLLSFPKLVISIPIFALFISLVILYYNNQKSQPTPGSCKILEEKFCSQAKSIKQKDPQGREFIYIGFNLPAGTAIFTPVDGQVSKAKINQPSPFQGFFAGMQDRSQNPPVSYSLNGDLQFPNLLSENVKAGQNIGSITNTGTKSFENYNLVVGVSRPDLTLGRFVSAEDILRKLFPVIKL